MTTAPKILDGDSGADGKPPTGKALNTSGFKAPAGYEVDTERAEVHNKAVAYQQQHNCSYADAAIAVGA
jgi:hypothetical protein